MNNVLFNVRDFWDDSDYARQEYVGAPLTDEALAAVERELGYMLPRAYVELSRQQNGGIPKRTNHRTQERTSWSEDDIALTGICSIGFEKPCSLCGTFGSKFWIRDWHYPSIGVYFADCPSAGHDMLCLDYRECGPAGEPRVVQRVREKVT